MSVDEYENKNREKSRSTKEASTDTKEGIAINDWWNALLVTVERLKS